MGLDKSYYTRAVDVAFNINAHLPADHQAGVLEEELRVAREVLAKRGLARRHVLLVGGAGYIGTVLTGHLLARGWRVRTLDNFIYGHQAAMMAHAGADDFEFMYGDLADRATVEKALDGITDVVILGGLVGDPITKKYPEASGRINDHGVQQLIGMLNGRSLNKALFISTCSNYGLIVGDNVADENYELSPLSLYAKSKVAGEQLLLAQKDKADYHGTALRFATAFGLSPRMRFDLTVSQFTRDMFLGGELVVFDADTWRPYCHVRDFSEVIRRVLEAPAEAVRFDVFNAGGDVNNFTKRMIVESVRKHLPEAKITYQEHGSDPRNYRVNFAKIQQRLNFTPRYTVEDGVVELLGALRQRVFAAVDTNADFHGNYRIDYPVA